MKTNIQFIPFAMLLNREIQRFMKVLAQTILTPMMTSTLYLLIFGVSLGASIQMSSGISFLEFLIPGLIMMGCLNNSFQNSSSSIVSAKFGGDLEDYRVSPLSNSQIVWALSLGGLARGLIVGGITFLVGEVFFYSTTGAWLNVHSWPIFVFFLALGGLSFAKFGRSVAFWAKTFDQMSIVGNFLLLPLIYLGGVFFSLEKLSPFWQSVSKFNPLLYLINGVRYGVLGQADVSLSSCILVSGVALVFFHFLALRSLNRGSFVRW